MSKISTEELSRQLNITTKKVDVIRTNAAVVDLAKGFKEIGNVSIGGLTDQLPDLVSKLKNGIPTDLASTLTDKLPGGLTELNSLFEGSFPQLHELGKLQILQDFGPPKGGIQALVKTSEDAIDDAQDDLPELLKDVKPALSKIDQSIASEIPELKIDISEADLANMDKVFSSPSGLGVDLKTIFAAATPTLPNTSSITKEVYTDGSIEAIAEELKAISGRDATQLKGLLEKFAGPNLTEDLDSLLNFAIDGNFVSQLKNTIDKLDTVISGTIDNLTGGGLLKGLAEKSTNNIGSVITSINLPNGAVNILEIKNDILSGNINAAKDKLTAGIKPPIAMAKILEKEGLSTKFENRNALKNAVSVAEKNATTPEEIAAIQQVKDKADLIDRKVNKDLASLNGNVTTTTTETPSNPNPISDANKSKVNSILTSKQEVIKYLQAANRKISCIRIFPISDRKNSKYQYLNADDAGNVFYEEYGPQYPNLDQTGPAHLYITGDGTIQTMRDINANSITSWEGNSYVLDIAINRFDNKNSPNNRQVESVVSKIISAFFTTFPSGEVYGGFYSDDDNFGVVPFWNIDISKYYPTKKNLHNPVWDLKYLSKTELLNLGREQSENAEREQRDNA